MKTPFPLCLLLASALSQVHAGIDTRLLGSPGFLPFGYNGDTPDNTIDDDQDGTVDEPDFITRDHIVGQTFTILPGQPIVTGLKMQTRDVMLFDDPRDIAVEFRIRVMEWDSVALRPTGVVLFESEAGTTVQDGATTEHSVSVPNLLLSTGKSYVVFMQQENPEPASGNNSLCQVLSRSGNPLASGNAVRKTNGTIGLAGIEAEPFTLSPDIDLSLQILTAALPSTFDTRGGGNVQNLPFGTVGEIDENMIDDDQDGIVDGPDPSLLFNHTIGQTFLVPAASSGLERVVFTIRDQQLNGAAPSNDHPLEATLTIMEWDNSAMRPAGPALHTSAPISSIQDGEPRELTFDGLALSLKPGKTYVAYLSQTDFGLTQGNNSLCAFLVRNDNPYPFGQVFRRSDASIAAIDLTSEAWVPVEADAVAEFLFSTLETTTDSNGDGLPDHLVAAYGLDPAVDYSALAAPLLQAGRDDVTGDPGNFSLFTAESIQDLDFGGLMLQKEGNTVDVSFDILSSPDLDEWTRIEGIQRQYTLTNDKSFLRVRSQEAQPVPTP